MCKLAFQTAEFSISGTGFLRSLKIRDWIALPVDAGQSHLVLHHLEQVVFVPPGFLPLGGNPYLLRLLSIEHVQSHSDAVSRSYPPRCPPSPCCRPLEMLCPTLVGAVLHWPNASTHHCPTSGRNAYGCSSGRHNPEASLAKARPYAESTAHSETSGCRWPVLPLHPGRWSFKHSQTLSDMSCRRCDAVILCS